MHGVTTKADTTINTIKPRWSGRCVRNLSQGYPGRWRKWFLTPFLGAREHDRGGGDNVVHARAAREVADRLREALQDGAHGARAGEALRQLVGDVARVEIG